MLRGPSPTLLGPVTFISTPRCMHSSRIVGRYRMQRATPYLQVMGSSRSLQFWICALCSLMVRSGNRRWHSTPYQCLAEPLITGDEIKGSRTLKCPQRPTNIVRTCRSHLPEDGFGPPNAQARTLQNFSGTEALNLVLVPALLPKALVVTSLGCSPRKSRQPPVQFLWTHRRRRAVPRGRDAFARISRDLPHRKKCSSSSRDTCRIPSGQKSRCQLPSLVSCLVV